LALSGAVIARVQARSGGYNLRMQARSGGYPTAPAAPPVWRGVLRMRGLGLLAARHSLSTNNPQLMHKILRHRSRQGSYSSPCAAQAAAPFARACWRWACLAGVVMLRPRRLGGSALQARWGGLKVRPPKICAPPRKIVGGWRKKLRRLGDDSFKTPR